MDNKLIDEIPQDMFYDLKPIGSGSFSDIFSATHVKTNTKVALKISFKTNNEKEMKVIDQEINVNKTLHHPFICKFFTSFETEHLKIIVMEIIEGISALDYVNNSGGLPISEARNLFTQLIIAIEYLHTEACIAHRDLKLENIMIDNYGHIRLIDFGFSSMNTMMTTCCGSIPYCAPEILSGQVYNKESDIWSMGIILYALIDGNLPFFHTNINSLVKIICQNEIKYPDTFDSDLIDLLQRMLSKDPETRIRIEDIKRHPFMIPEKLLQINYKQIFSRLQSSPSKSNSLSANKASPNLYSANDTGQYINPKMTKFAFHSNNILKNRKKNHFPNLIHIHSTKHAELTMFNKMPSHTDNLNESILSRKNFSLNLNMLIESSLFDKQPLQPISMNQQNITYMTRSNENNLLHSKKHAHILFKNPSPILQPNGLSKYHQNSRSTNCFDNI